MPAWNFRPLVREQPSVTVKLLEGMARQLAGVPARAQLRPASGRSFDARRRLLFTLRAPVPARAIPVRSWKLRMLVMSRPSGS